MKHIILIIILVIAAAAGISGWLVMGSSTAFSEKSQYLYIKTGKANEADVMEEITNNKLVKYPGVFKWLAGQMDIWKSLKPGRFEIVKGESLLSISRKLRNNKQSPVKFVINKVRIPQDLAKIMGKNFEVDSSEVITFLHSADSLSNLGVDSNTFLTLIIPNTYNILWNSSVSTIMKRMKMEKESFWEKNDRAVKAEQMGFSPLQISIIASIVEEETNKNDEKGKVASVYINRYHKGMPLGADPTIKFALKDFGLKRIYYKHLEAVSPYNTYKNKGLPPGPITTPTPKTIDAVLDAPSTEYLFFVAKSDFSGYHTFATNFAEHKQYAKEYQNALDEQILKKQALNKSEK